MRRPSLLPLALAAMSMLIVSPARSLQDVGSAHPREEEKLKLIVELGSNEMTGGISFSAGGDWILTNYSGNANLWETATGRQIRHLASTHRGIGNDAAYSPTDDRVALISNDTVPSVITSKAANGYHFKTGQRKGPGT